MSYEFPPRIAQLVKQQLRLGTYQSEDEVLLAALRSLESQQAEWAAIREALESLEQGDPGLSLDDAFETVRKRHGVPSDA